MNEPKVFSVYDFEPVSNVCEQTLREPLALGRVSMAHVMMEPKAVSLLHNHARMNEAYFILEGEGILYSGKRPVEVAKGSFRVLPKGTPHKLKNTGEGKLEHLVFASPPFNAQDVTILDESQYKELPVVKRSQTVNPTFIASDGARVCELADEKQKRSMKASFAVGYLDKGRTALSHVHHGREEVYYVVAGHGRVTIGNRTEKVEKGSIAFVPKHYLHALQNLSDTDKLEVLCITSPPYRDDDFHLAFGTSEARIIEARL